MIKRFRLRLCPIGCLAFALAVHVAWAAGRPEIIQTLTGFNRPVSAVFSENGDTLFVVNRARGEVGVLRHQGSVSKVARMDGGKFGEPNHRFVTRLTGPSDVALAPIAFGDVPKGSLFVVTGTPLIENETGRIIKDASGEYIGITVIDAQTGRVLREIDLGPSSEVLLQRSQALISPTSIEFDHEGNLFIGDTGIGGHLFISNRMQGQPKIWRLTQRSVMELLSGLSPSGAKPMPISSLPGDMRYDASSDSLYFITNHNQGAPTGSVFKVEGGEFKGIQSLQTIVRSLPALSGLQLSPKGRAIMTSNNGEILMPRGRKNYRVIRFRPEVRFATPGNFALYPLAAGASLLAIPEEGSDAGLNKGQSVQIVKLPEGY